MRLLKALVLAAFALCASAAFAQTIKIGFITSYSGLNGNLGPYMERAVRLYVKLHQKELPPGVKIELLTRDDTGPNPDKARQLAQELVVSDFGPGHDSEEAFIKGFTEGGGKIVGSVRVPLQNPDWAAYMQRVKDARPDALKVFVPAGKTATAVMKNFSELGLDKAGIKLIGPGDITTDEELPNMGDVAIGVLTVHHYSAAAERPANKAFVAAWKKEYGADEVPNFLSAGSWDGTDMIFAAIKAQKGKLDPDRTMEIFKHYKNADSPRGPISIDPETRDIVQNEYLREVRKVGGQPANVELETVATAVKDPWKALQKKK